MVNSSSGDLFQTQDLGSAEKGQSYIRSPLAHRVRPESFEQFYGQEQIFRKFPFLKEQSLPSLILAGPPGTGKTTLAQVLAHHRGLELYSFNAVLGGIADLKKLIARAKETQDFYKKPAVIFVDEIHRFNKAQQDALLPFVEKGDFIFIGATTEHPKTSINRALLSRVHLVTLEKLSDKAIEEILLGALEKEGRTISDDLLSAVARLSDGDARFALNALEAILLRDKEPSLEELKDYLGGGSRHYDKDKDRHYDVISAFIKSMRGTDPDAALLYLAIMLDGGEDPKFIARRLVIFASEDIGNADPQALSLAVAGLHAVEAIGMPEARINLAHVTTYLASTQKSNAAYSAINMALSYVRERTTIEVPSHLRNQHPDGKNYRYPHDYPNAYISQQYSPKGTPKFYNPKENGTEARIKARLEGLKK